MRARLRPSAIAIGSIIALVTVIGSLLVSGADRAEAHASLIGSNPKNGEKVARAPSRVVMNFSEPIERKLTKIEVFDKDANRVDQGGLEFDDQNAGSASVGVKDLPPGLYVVRFDNVSTVDGHPWTGAIQFVVLNPDGSVPAGAEFDPNAVSVGGGTGLLPAKADAALRWIALLAVAVVAGSAFWVFVVARPAAAFLEKEDYDNAIKGADGWLAALGHALLPAAFIAMALLVLVTWQRFETGTSVISYLTSIRTGEYRLLFELSALLGLVSANVVHLAGSPRVRAWGSAALLFWSLVALLTFSLTSHGAATDGAFWAVLSDYIHLLAAAAWLGALAMLLPVMRWAKRELDDAERFLYTANIFDRFSIIASLSVIVVLATGTFNALAQIPSIDALYETTYGRVLLVKLGLMLPLLAVAALNAFVLKPRLVRAIDEVFQSGSTASAPQRAEAEGRLERLQRTLPLTIAAEVALVIAVFASVAVLTQTSTARGEVAQVEAAKQQSTEFTDQKPAGDLQLQFGIQPNRVGLNRYELVIKSADGSPVTKLAQVRLRFFYTDPSNPDLQVGQTDLVLNEFEPGAYRGSGAYFSQAGTWRVEAGIRRTGQDDVARNFVVSVAPPEARTADGGGRFSLPFTSLGWNEVVGALLMILGASAMLYGKPLARVLATRDRWVASSGALVVVAGFVLTFAIQAGHGGAGLAAGNPIDPTAESVLRGRLLFQQNCIVCHGTTGRGDGPNAANIDPKPTDFRLHLPLHNDPQFFAFIANGFPGSAMPAWRDQIAGKDIWNLVNFLRAEFTEAPAASTDGN